MSKVLEPKPQASPETTKGKATPRRPDTELGPAAKSAPPPDPASFPSSGSSPGAKASARDRAASQSLAQGIFRSASSKDGAAAPQPWSPLQRREAPAADGAGAAAGGARGGGLPGSL